MGIDFLLFLQSLESKQLRAAICYMEGPKKKRHQVHAFFGVTQKTVVEYQRRERRSAEQAKRIAAMKLTNTPVNRLYTLPWKQISLLPHPPKGTSSMAGHSLLAMPPRSKPSANITAR